MKEKIIDVTFDFTSDTKGYWDGYWERRDGLGLGGADPDSESPTLRMYHKILWSKALPNGDYMDLQFGTPKSKNYLVWKDFRFASDSLITGFRYKCLKNLIYEIREKIPNYFQWQEKRTRHSYTIGGMIIFPMHKNSINGQRGMNYQIRDRIDLTMECIRRFYNNEESPLSWVLESDSKFFNLFVDFKGFVDYFLLQDIVSKNYKSVKFFLKFDDFNYEPLPKNIEEFMQWKSCCTNFLNARNHRIDQWQKKNLRVK